jgi:hypothetical protein
MPTQQIVPVLVRRLRHDDLDEGAATTDVLYDAKGHAHHRTRRSGVVDHGKAHEVDEATFVTLRKGRGDQILWVGDERLEVLRFEYVGPRKNGKHPGHHAAPAAAGTGHDPSWSVTHTTGSSGDPMPNPFRAITRPCGGELGDRIVASGPPDPHAATGFYKVTFIVGGQEVDPDFEIVP